MAEAVCYGIDLGTTNSCISIYYEGSPVANPAVVENFDYQQTTPSVVNFDEKQILIGKNALNRRSQDPVNTIYNAKRLIGRKFSDSHVRQDSKELSYNIKKGENDLPVVCINRGSFKQLELKIEQISAFILHYLKKSADIKCAKESDKVVITVPANFNGYQRRATMDAGKIANMEIISVISEPTAACIAHVYYKGYDPAERYFLVYDYGGGTLDVSLVHTKGCKFTVCATAGDSHCGGADIDQFLLKMAINRIKERGFGDLNALTTDSTINNRNKITKSLLLSLCEETKRHLSSTNRDEIILPDIQPGKTFIMAFNKGDIDNIVLDLKDKLIQPIDIVLTQSGKKCEEINEIILVGGSSRIPKVKEILTERFNKPCFSPTNPDEAIALGASLYGAFKLGKKIKNFPDFQIIDVTPMNIGFGTKTGIVQVAVPRNTPRPAKSPPKAFRVSNPNAKSVSLELYEGDSKHQKDCFCVGKYDIELPPGLDYDDKSRIFQRVDVTDEEITMYATIGPSPEEADENFGEKKLIIKNNKNVNSADTINKLKNDLIKMLTTIEPPE